MCRGFSGARGPRFTQPICDGYSWLRVLHALPVYTTVAGLRHVSEYGVFEYRVHGHRVRRPGRAGRHAEEPELWIDSSQLPVLVETHPDDIIAHALHLVAW